MLDDFGRHDDAVRLASSLLLVWQAPRHRRVIELEVRVLGNRAFCYETVGRYGDAATTANLRSRRPSGLATTCWSPGCMSTGRTCSTCPGGPKTRCSASAAADRTRMPRANGTTCHRRHSYRSDTLSSWRVRRGSGVVSSCRTACRGRHRRRCELRSRPLMRLRALAPWLRRWPDTRSIDMLSNRPLSWLEGRAWLGVGLCLARLGDRPAPDALLLLSHAFQAAANTPSKLTALLELATLKGVSRAPAIRGGGGSPCPRSGRRRKHAIHACIAHLKLAEFSRGGQRAASWLGASS